MRFSASNTTTRRIDWKAERERIDLAAVANRLLGPAPGRRGERGRKLWWRCPLGTHEDRNPSFAVDPGKRCWKCWGCGESGDAAALVMRLQGMTFPEAVAYLTGGAAPSGKVRTLRQRPPARPSADPPAQASGMPEADALALVAEAERRLWTAEGAKPLAYLRARGLTGETIRAARLGYTPVVRVPAKDGRSYTARGVVIPWFQGPRLALAKVRQPEGTRPKYAEVFRDPARVSVYPCPRVIRTGRPLIVAEGELDALCLGEALGELAAVVTLGSASARPDPDILGRMLAAAVWFIATDNDEAGDKAAAGWPARARRVRPPLGKDWTEARQGGVNLRRWWGDVLAGVDRPPPFTWDELAAVRWGAAADDCAPGLVVERPDRERLRAAIEAPIADPHAADERQAIREENR